VNLQVKNLKKLVQYYGTEIRYTEVGDHKKLGVIDRFVRTLREMINKYCVMHNTTKFINALPDLVYNYNSSKHSGIKAIPKDVQTTDKDITALQKERYKKALKQETKYNVGDTVRYIVNKKAFEKGSLPKWSKDIHTIENCGIHSYTLDNGKIYKYYEMQKIGESHSMTSKEEQPTREQLKKDITSKRRMNREGLGMSTVINTRRTRSIVKQL